jgi:hypothetical protein
LERRKRRCRQRERDPGKESTLRDGGIIWRYVGACFEYLFKNYFTE